MYVVTVRIIIIHIKSHSCVSGVKKGTVPTRGNITRGCNYPHTRASNGEWRVECIAHTCLQKHIRYRTCATSHLLASASSYTREREVIISRALPSSSQALELESVLIRYYSRVLKLLLASIKSVTRELLLGSPLLSVLCTYMYV